MSRSRLKAPASAPINDGVRDVVELGLRKPDAPASASKAALKNPVDAFLKLFLDFAPNADDQNAKGFATTIGDLRARIASSDHDREIRRLAASAVRACERFLKGSRHYYASREAELTEMIGILMDTAKHIAGDASEFNADLQVTSERFKGIAQLDDIRELRKTVADEAIQLQKRVEKKQKRDEAAFTVLTRRVATLQTLLCRAEEQAALDPLTKIPNRVTFHRSLAGMVKAAKASGTPLSLAMLDIDYFKTINDTHGHPVGDRVLLCAAQWLVGAVRPTDVVARYGGEEFAAILAGTDLAAASTRLRAVLEQIAGRSFEYEEESVTKSVRFTVSCGVAQLAAADDERDLIQRAGQALYDAKRSGRGRVVTKERSTLGALFG